LQESTGSHPTVGRIEVRRPCLVYSRLISGLQKPLLKRLYNHYFHNIFTERIPVMKRLKFFAPYLALLMLVGSIGACASHKDEKSQVIKKTTTTTERPAVEETKTTTTIER
jgi:hypothetical protein